MLSAKIHPAEGMTQRGPSRALLRGVEWFPADTLVSKPDNGDGG
jgi:hypothetical protein